ncbi:MAG: EAL domain-containing protein [Acidimicrobiaceae bacterium]|nr:EAL domain-containing protein [Acidimicrobiaceae bacterium]MBO0748046.1 EAL domain-containing protein [Acidimicrobiaceae bacterium]
MTVWTRLQAGSEGHPIPWYPVLDHEPEQAFDDIARLAALLCDVPIALVSMLAENRVWFKARVGLELTDCPWEEAICPFTADSSEPFIVPDASKDPLFAHLPTVAGPPHLRFYTGVRIPVPRGENSGMLCVLDYQPRRLGDAQIEGLKALARQASSLLERRADTEQIRLAGERWLGAEAARSTQELIIRDLEERFHLVFGESPIGMAVVNLERGGVSQLLQVNRALADFLGYPEDDLRGATLASITHPFDHRRCQVLVDDLLYGVRDQFDLEVRYVHRDGNPRWGTVRASVLRDAAGERARMLCQVVDGTTRHHYEERLARAAQTDVLTGLSNRFALLEQLTRILENPETSAGLLLVNLDGFKLVNNSFGHSAGDEVLRVVAARFSDVIGPTDLLARLGGDEFAVLCRDLRRSAAIELAEALIGCLTEPILAAGQEMFLSASVGLAWTDPEDERPGVVLENADSAMGEAKRRGRARWELFDDHLRGGATLRARRASALRAALHGHQLEMHYQPVVDLESGQVVSAEALVRWNHPEEGVIWPADFISAAEENGSIVALGGWALRAACSEAVKWGKRGPSVSVNVSARQLADDGLYDVVAEAINRTGLTPDRLTLEVTETAVMEDADHAVRVLRRLKSLGLAIAVDDFGTGYSSLVYLKRLPVDKLKIDRSFIDCLPEDTEDAAIVSSVVSLAQAVGLQVIAEGVETDAQWEALLALGCDYGQGFLWGYPLPAREATARFNATGAWPRTGARSAFDD